MTKKFYSNGKLLITGEYLVLNGAKALALPTKFGQDLIVENEENNQITWKSFDSDGSVWFEDTISFETIKLKLIVENQTIKNNLILVLHEAYLLNPDFILNSKGYKIQTNLTFPRFWGLGSSSTLINNMAQWLNINAFTLLKNSFGGSGYDIASAQNNNPILYQLLKEKPSVEKVIFNPKFSNQLYFVYLNKKQNSRTAIVNYYSKKNNIPVLLPKIDAITKAILNASDLLDFKIAVENHEDLISEILETPTIKETLFPDFKGTIKSLGAWGGDFIMVISKENPSDYFIKKGFETIIPYHEMIL